MPIKDLSNRGRIPRLGKIKLGIKVPGTKSEYPKATDYFVCPEEVRAVYGEKPKRLNIAFHSDDIEEVFPQYYKRYGKSTGLVCKGDGEIANCMNPEIKEFEEIECMGTECDFYKKDQCKRIGNLHFIILGVNRFGVYQLDTGSINTILNINGGIDYAKKLTNGRLNLMPFILEVIPQEVSPDGKKKTVWVLRLEADISRMMKSLDSKPGELLSIQKTTDPNKDIEENLYPDQIVESLKATDAQRTRMWTMSSKAGLKEEEFKKYLVEKYKISSTKELTKSQIEEIFSYLENKIEENKKEEETIEAQFELSEKK